MKTDTSYLANVRSKLHSDPDAIREVSNMGNGKRVSGRGIVREEEAVNRRATVRTFKCQEKIDRGPIVSSGKSALCLLVVPRIQIALYLYLIIQITDMFTGLIGFFGIFFGPQSPSDPLRDRYR